MGLQNYWNNWVRYKSIFVKFKIPILYTGYDKEKDERKDNKLVRQRDVSGKYVKTQDGRVVPKQEDK